MQERQEEITLQAERERLNANLLRSISHDLRTPLTSISGNAGMLFEQGAQLGEEKCHALYADIYDDALWLIELVENLLSLTRLDSVGIRTEPVLLDEVIDEALRHVNQRDKQQRIECSLPEELLMVRVDPKLIMQVIINLVDNAVKYTPAGSRIVVLARRQEVGRWWRL